MSLQRMQLSKARLEEALRVSDMPYYLQCVNLIFFFPHNSSFPSIFSSLHGDQLVTASFSY